MFNSTSLNDTSKSFTFCDSNNINHFIFSEKCINSDFLFEKTLGECNFLSNSTTVNLDFKDLILLLTEIEFAQVCVSNNSNYSAVFFNSLEENILSFLVEIFFMMSKGSLFRVCPILVETLLGVSINGLGPD